TVLRTPAPYRIRAVPAAPFVEGSHGSAVAPRTPGGLGAISGPPSKSDVIHRPSGSASRRRPDHQVFQRPAIHHAGHRVGDLLPELAQVVRVGAVVPSLGPALERGAPSFE